MSQTRMLVLGLDYEGGVLGLGTEGQVLHGLGFEISRTRSRTCKMLEIIIKVKLLFLCPSIFKICDMPSTGDSNPGLVFTIPGYRRDHRNVIGTEIFLIPGSRRDYATKVDKTKSAAGPDNIHMEAALYSRGHVFYLYQANK